MFVVTKFMSSLILLLILFFNPGSSIEPGKELKAGPAKGHVLFMYVDGRR